MRHRKELFRLCCAVLICSLIPTAAVALEAPSQAGPRKLEGGQRDLAWPVPGQYNLSSCYLDNRNHCSLDIAAPMGTKVVASYEGKVVDIFTDCIHNWGKNGNCCSSWGNYVLLEHNYTLSDGKTVTLYSRYAHLKAVSVRVGQVVLRGEKVGTIGSTGRSTGPHLDYDVLYNGISPSRTYSVDPYINELLELPPELYTTFGKCCQEYVAYVKELYTSCFHSQYNSNGACVDCGYVYNWKTTRDIDDMGYYTVSAQTQAYPIPYPQTEGTVLAAGQKLSVNAMVVNGLGQIWYEVALSNGSIVFAPKSALVFHSYFSSQMQLENCTVSDGMVLKQESYRLDGTITSSYPLRKIVGYLDGKQYASWTSSGGIREAGLRHTALNQKLNFSQLTPGKHTLEIYVTDSTGREPMQIYSCSFEIVKALATHTVTYLTEDPSEKTFEDGQSLGELPHLTKEGWIFLGWFTEDGQQVTVDTKVTGDMQLQPKWEEIPPETEPTIPTEPEETPTQPTTVPETEPVSQPEEPTEETPDLWWMIPVVLAVIGTAVGVILWLQKKKSAQALF